MAELPGPTTYDPELRRLTGAAGAVAISKGAADLLDLLLARPGRLVSRESVMAKLHDDWQVVPRTLDVAVCRLRKVLAQAGSDWSITTVRDAGWTLERRTRPAGVQPL